MKKKSVKRIHILVISAVILLLIMASCTPAPSPGDASNEFKSAEPSPGEPENSCSPEPTVSTPADTTPADEVPGISESSPASSTGNPSAATGRPSSSAPAQSASQSSAPVAASPPPAPESPAALPTPVSYVKTPSAAGTEVYINDELSGVSTIDYSNTSQGYVMLKNTGSENRLKAQVVAPNGKDYSYDLQANDQYIVLPLQGGNGEYTVRIMENISQTSYRAIALLPVSVSLQSEYLPFLYPNQRVNFSKSSNAVSLAAELTRGVTSDLKKIEIIYTYITGNIKYDTAKAASVQSGYISNPDSTLSSKKGICLDYAVLLATMLRSQGIPTQMTEGNVDGGRHAWNYIYTKEKGVIAVKISFNGGWKLVDSTYGASLGEGIESYIGNGDRYVKDKAY